MDKRISHSHQKNDRLNQGVPLAVQGKEKARAKKILIEEYDALRETLPDEKFSNNGSLITLLRPQLLCSEMLERVYLFMQNSHNRDAISLLLLQVIEDMTLTREAEQPFGGCLTFDTQVGIVRQKLTPIP